MKRLMTYCPRWIRAVLALNIALVAGAGFAIAAGRNAAPSGCLLLRGGSDYGTWLVDPVSGQSQYSPNRRYWDGALSNNGRHKVAMVLQTTGDYALAVTRLNYRMIVGGTNSYCPKGDCVGKLSKSPRGQLVSIESFSAQQFAQTSIHSGQFRANRSDKVEEWFYITIGKDSLQNKPPRFMFFNPTTQQIVEPPTAFAITDDPIDLVQWHSSSSLAIMETGYDPTTQQPRRLHFWSTADQQMISFDYSTLPTLYRRLPDPDYRILSSGISPPAKHVAMIASETRASQNTLGEKFLEIFDLDEKIVRRVGLGQWESATVHNWSPSGKHLVVNAFTQSEGSHLLVIENSKQPSIIAKLKPVGYVESAAWDADGKSLYYITSFHADHKSTRVDRLNRLDVHNATVTTVQFPYESFLTLPNTMSSQSLGNNRLLVSVKVNGIDTYFMMRMDGSEPIARLAQPKIWIARPIYSRELDALVYLDFDYSTMSYTFYSVKLETGEHVVLAENVRMGYWEQWPRPLESPKMLVFVAKPDGQQGAVQVLDLTTGELRTVVTDVKRVVSSLQSLERDPFIDWVDAHGQRWHAHVNHQINAEIRLPIIVDKQASSESYVHSSVSPDKQKLVYWGVDIPSDFVLHTGNNKNLQLTIAKRTPQQHFNVVWSVDSRYFAVQLVDMRSTHRVLIYSSNGELVRDIDKFPGEHEYSMTILWTTCVANDERFDLPMP